MLSLLKSNFTMIVVGVVMFTSLSAMGMTKLYLDKRDQLAVQKVETSLANQRAKLYAQQLEDELARVQMLEQLRIDLANQIDLLENQEVEVITEVRELWRDREVIVNNPIAVECAAEPVPDSILGLLCHTDTRGACSALQPST